MNNRPARIIAAVVGLLTALATMAAVFGLGLTQTQLAGVVSGIALLGAAAQGLFTEAKVVSPASAKELLQAPSSDADPLAVLRLAKSIGATATEVVLSKGAEK